MSPPARHSEMKVVTLKWVRDAAVGIGTAESRTKTEVTEVPLDLVYMDDTYRHHARTR